MVSVPRPAASRSSDMSVKMLAAAIAQPPASSQGAQPSTGAAGAGSGKGKSSSLPLIGGAGVVILALMGGGGYYFLAGSPTPPEPVRPPVIETPPPVNPPQVNPPPDNPPPVNPLPVSPPPVNPPPVSPPPANPPPENPPPVNPPPVNPPPVLPPPVLPPIDPPVSPPPAFPPARPTPDPGDAIRGEVASFVSRLPCSLIDGDVRDGAVVATGIAGKSAIDSLRQKLTGMGLTKPPPSLRVTQVDPIFCPWEDLLRPVARTFGDGGNRLTLRLPGDPAWLQKDDYIRPQVAMGDFRGDLRVDYLDRQGNVLHMYPQLGDPKEHLVADPPHVFTAGETINLGEPSPENRGWQVDEPYGTDMIIAIASEDALFDRPRPANIEKAANYLRDLKKAVEAARTRGARITATAMPLETRKK